MTRPGERCLEIGGCGFHDHLEYNDYRGFALPTMGPSHGGRTRPIRGSLDRVQAASGSVTGYGVRGIGQERSMSDRDSARGWLIAVACPDHWLSGWRAVGAVAWRGLGPTDRAGSARNSAGVITSRGRAGCRRPTGSDDRAGRRLSDPRLELAPAGRRILAGGRPARGAVVDQVCLVPDVPAFLEAIAAWDERHFFPDPDRRAGLDIAVPARVSSRAGGAVRAAAARPCRGTARWRARPTTARCALWSRRSRPCLEPGQADPRSASDAARTPACRLVHWAPRRRAWSCPPAAPMLAGAVALAAGRFQPLVRLPSRRVTATGPAHRVRTSHGDSATCCRCRRPVAVRAKVEAASPR